MAATATQLLPQSRLGDSAAGRRRVRFPLDGTAPRTLWKEGGVVEFLRDEDGQGLVEYAIILGLIAAAVIIAMIFLRGQLQNTFSDIGNHLRPSPTPDD